MYIAVIFVISSTENFGLNTHQAFWEIDKIIEAKMVHCNTCTQEFSETSSESSIEFKSLEWNQCSQVK